MEYAGLYSAQNFPGTMQLRITGVPMTEEPLY
jgi:hypothetical protein